MADRNKHTDLFREKSVTHFSSPENLDKYIKTTTPSLWLVLSAIILILIGIIIFSVFGKIDSYSTIGCKVSNGDLTAYISESEFEKIKDSSYIEIDETIYTINKISGPYISNEDSDSFLCTASGIDSNTWYYVLNCKSQLAEGSYKCRIIFEKISPISFVIN